MAAVTPLDRYRAYLNALDKHARDTPEDEHIDLLGPGEVIDLLTIRDKLTTAQLAPSQHAELDRLDGLLLKYRHIVTGNVPSYPHKPRSHWWWHLEEGPRVREQALAAARAD